MTMTAEQTTVAETIHGALRYMVERDDGAKASDGVGFNATDTYFGTHLASLPTLSPAQVAVAAKMLRKYKAQLAAYGPLPDVEDVETYVAETTRARAAAAPAQTTPCRVYLRTHKKAQRVVVEYPYSMIGEVKPLLDVFKSGPRRIDDWQFNLFGSKEWSYPAQYLDTILDALAPVIAEFSVAPEIAAVRQLQQEQRDLEAQHRQAEIDAALSRVASEINGELLPCNQALFAHQREAVRQLIEGQRMILAHDMGLGKTRVALVAAKAYDAAVIVVCPSSLKINWLREAEAVGVAIEVWSWAKLPEPPECTYVLVADEAHYAQGGERTQRGSAFLDLAEQARAVFCLTGTPLKNGRPINLFPLLKACHHPLAVSLRAYEDRYCAAYQRTIGTGRNAKKIIDVTGAAHLDELYRKTSGTTILYKKKKDCLDLPTKTRVFREIEVSSTARKEYLATLQRLREESEARIAAAKAKQDALIEAAKEAGEELDEDELKDPDNAKAIVELGILRHAGSLAKVESAIEIAQEIVEQGESIVIFTAYLETLRRIAEATNAETITGGQTTEQRQAAIDRFQAKQNHVIVCMLGAGGVGITLTAAQTVLLVDRPWTPGDAIQAEDRIHRIGQTENVTAIWLQYEAIDAKVDALLQAKQERIELVLSGKRKSMRGIKSIQSLAKSILKAIKTHKDVEDIESDEEIEAPIVDVAEEVASEANNAVSYIQNCDNEEAPPPVKAKHPGGRPRKEDNRTPVLIKLPKHLKDLTATTDRSQLIIDLLNAHFGTTEE